MKKIILRIITPLVVMLVIPWFASAELQTIYETFTEQSRNPAGWKKRDNACKYSIAAAKRKASKKCKTERHGKIVEITDGDSNQRRKVIEQCTDCRQSEYFHEWYCTGKATVKCEYTAEKKDTGTINQLRGRVQKNKKVYTETDNPCSKDTNTRACLDYRNELKKNTSQGVRD